MPDPLPIPSLPSRLRPRQRASTLIVALGILALISLLAFSFLGISRSERMISRNYVDQVRASMLAQSGLEQAIARLRASTLEKAWDDPRDPWIYHDNDGAGIGAAIPLATAASPSCWAGTSFDRPYSAAFPGTYAEEGDVAVLKVLDCAGQLNLNGAQTNLGVMLDTLGLAIRDEHRLRGFPLPTDPVRGRGGEILRLRDRLGGRFLSEASLIPLLGSDDFDLLRDYITVWGWEDPTTIVRTGPPAADGLPRIALQRRAPVDINTAPRAVLQAVIAGLAATGSEAISFDLAGRIADRILARRVSDVAGEGPFIAWNELYAFFDALAQTPNPLLTPPQAACAKANFNPNAVLHAFNPEAHLRLPIDKSDLTYATTEFTFRSMGCYEIESLGRVIRPDGEITAETLIRATPVIYDLAYATTQDDFEDGRASTPADGTTSFPVSCSGVAPARPAWYSGYLHLQTALRMPAPGVGRTLTAFWQDSLNATADTPDPVALGFRTAGVDLLEGSDLLPDGTYGNDRRGKTLGYSTGANLTDIEGAIEFWVKFDESPSIVLQPLFTATHPITSQTGLQHVLKGAIAGGALLLESSRLFYVAEDFAPAASRLSYPAPFANEKTVISAVISGKGQPNEWHHLVLTWFDGTNQRLHVDGKACSVTTYAPTSDARAEAGELPYAAVCTFGGRVDAAGRAEFPAMTIDDVIAYDRASAFPPGNFLPRDRFEGLDPVYNGVWTGAFPPLPYPVTLGPMTWTEWIPETWDGKPLAKRSTGLAFGATRGPGNPGKGGGTYNPGKGASDTGAPPGQTQASPAAAPPGGGSPASTPPAGGAPQENPAEKGPPDHPPPKGGKKSALPSGPSPICWYIPNPNAAANALAAKDRAKLKLPANKNGANAQTFGAPRVLVAYDSVYYTFQFVNPTSLSPMDVTPIIDDILLIYQGPLRFLAYHIDSGS